MPTAPQIQQAVNDLYIDAGKLHQVVHGDADTVVTTETGTVKSLANLQREFNLDADEALGQADTARDEAVAARNEAVPAAATAVAAATAAEDARDIAAGAQNYFATRAAGAAATPTGQIFTSDEEGSLAWYVRTATGPNYALIDYPATRDFFAADLGSTRVTHLPAGTGGNATGLAAIFNRLHVWTEDYDSFQEAFDAAVSRGAELHFRPGQTYTWPSTGVSISSKIRLVATGARIEVASAITMLTLSTGADGSEIEGGEWVYTGSTTSGYNVASNGILVTGTQNGAGVAPTFIENVWVRNAIFKGFGNNAVEWRYTKNCGDESVRVLNGGFSGIYCYSVDTYRSSKLFVNTLAGQLNTGSLTTSELNAYGFVATALTGTSPGDTVDRVQDPYSRNIIVDKPTIINVPTWHAINTHGSDGMIVSGATIINCRCGVVFTGLTDRGTTNSKAINCVATNTFAASARNGNTSYPDVGASYKKGEAFWDIGPTSTLRNSGNRFEGCSSFGHGNPGFDEGAVTIANADDGFYGISDTESQRVGWKFGSNISRATVYARSVNTRHATVTPSVARVDGNNADIRVARWKSGKRNGDLSGNVMVNGILVNHTITGTSIQFEDFSLDDCTAGEVVSTSGFIMAATLTGNYSVLADITMTGITGGTATTTVRLFRQGRLCTMQLPINVLTGTGSDTATTLTGIPAAFRPAGTTAAGVAPALDGAGGGTYVLAIAQIGSDGVITLTRDADNNTSAWTASGPRTLRGGPLQWLA